MEGNIVGQVTWMGNFNTILNMDDILNVCPIHQNKIKGLRDFLSATGMTKIKVVGRQYTWTNSQLHCRIDRVLVNVEWMDSNPLLEERLRICYFLITPFMC